MMIKGIDAWTNMTSTSNARWPAAEKHLIAPVEIAHDAAFSFKEDAQVFCIGSCFARNIEEQLICRGVKVLSRGVQIPMSEWPYRINGLLNKFTIGSVLNELRWAVSPPSSIEACFDETEQGCVDLHLSPIQKPVTSQRAIERRKDLMETYFPKIFQADFVIITLGLNQVWYDAENDQYLNATPSLRSVKRSPERFFLKVLSASEALAGLVEIYTLLKCYSAKPCRLIITVSPVPLSVSLSGTDSRQANAYSKSVLRVAAEEFVLKRDDCVYFPSYEMITTPLENVAYAADGRHVKNSVVRDVMGYFAERYLADRPLIVPDEFSEFAYLKANPDVEDAVRRGQYESGVEHFLRSGRQEGRKIFPENPEKTLLNSGAID